MNEAIIYISVIMFIFLVFPIHIFNYIYINSEEKYAGINITLYRFIKIFNINTVKNKPTELQINGKNKKSSDLLKYNYYKIFNRICVYKIVQLSDFGINNQNNVYAALMQHTATTALYKFLEINGNFTKLRNYTVFNEEHSYVRYYAKAVTIINMVVVIKILLILLMEKLNEIKVKQK